MDEVVELQRSRPLPITGMERAPMFDDRVPDPITRVGPSRDRPFEGMHFERVEPARDAGDSRSRARQRPPRRQAVSAAPAPAPEPPAGQDDLVEARDIGTQLDVHA